MGTMNPLRKVDVSNPPKITFAMGLIPLAINGDLAGNEIQSPMAKVILGGLLTSTFLNGFIVPIVYRFTAAKKKSNH
jgi:Cu/Ag efflux pump CusA